MASQFAQTPSPAPGSISCSGDGEAILKMLKGLVDLVWSTGLRIPGKYKVIPLTPSGPLGIHAFCPITHPPGPCAGTGSQNRSSQPLICPGRPCLPGSPENSWAGTWAPISACEHLPPLDQQGQMVATGAGAGNHGAGRGQASSTPAVPFRPGCQPASPSLHHGEPDLETDSWSTPAVRGFLDLHCCNLGRRQIKRKAVEKNHGEMPEALPDFLNQTPVSPGHFCWQELFHLMASQLFRKLNSITHFCMGIFTGTVLCIGHASFFCR